MKSIAAGPLSASESETQEVRKLDITTWWGFSLRVHKNAKTRRAFSAPEASRTLALAELLNYRTGIVQRISDYGENVSRNNFLILCFWFSQGDKGRFRKRVVFANVPSFRLSFRGNMRTYPRSGFSFRGNIRTYPHSDFCSGGTPPKPPFWKPPFWKPPFWVPPMSLFRVHLDKRNRISNSDQLATSQWLIGRTQHPIATTKRPKFVTILRLGLRALKSQERVTLLVGIEMSSLGYRDFSIFFSVSRSSLTSILQDVEAQKSTNWLWS